MATAKKATKQEKKPSIQSYEDACKALNREPLTLDDFSPKLPADKRQYLLSMERVTTFIEALKEGHEFDWNSYEDRKHYPWWDMETYGDEEPGSGTAPRHVALRRRLPIEEFRRVRQRRVVAAR